MRYPYVLGILVTVCLVGCAEVRSHPQDMDLQKEGTMVKKVVKSEAEWKRMLTPEQFSVLRKGGTERAFTGKFNTHFKEGVYLCAACQAPLFDSETKFDHGCGWPSFFAPIGTDTIEYVEDNSLGMRRIEVRCASCGSHLGHVFDDGPQPTGQRYCINSIAMDFTSEAPATAEDRVRTAIFAAGCFWGVEHKFSQIEGVESTRVGYTGGRTENPSYRQVCSATTGHAEAVEVKYDPSLVSYEELLDSFFKFHDPTQLNRQGPDRGTQYRSAIFYASAVQKDAAVKSKAKLNASKKYGSEVVTEIAPISRFFMAEEYHQQYLEKRGQSSCGF